MAPYSVLLVSELGDDLRLVRLNRPEKRNALSVELIEQLTAALLEAASSSAIRGVLVAGVGHSFSAGVDLHEFDTVSRSDAERLIRSLAQLCRTLRTLPLPVACAIQGYCLGGALELAACCDFRVCTPDAQLGMPEVFLGIPSVIDAVMLQHHIGAGRAHELLLTGDSISGQTALDWGLVNRLAPAERLIDEAALLLRRVSRHAASVVADQKRLHQAWLELDYEQAVERSIERLVEAIAKGRPQQLARQRLRRPAELPKPSPSV